MSVVLLILKIIGIALLCILGLIFLILTVVLWVPIRYQGNVVYDRTLSLHAGISWLLKLLQIRFDYENGGTDLAVRVFGKRINKPKEKAPEEVQPDAAEASPPETQSGTDGETKTEANAEAQPEAAEEKPEAAEEKPEAAEEKPEALPAQAENASGQAGGSPEQAGEAASADGSADQSEEKPESKPEKEKKGASVIDKLKHLFIETDRGQRALAHVLKYIGKILRSVLPKIGTGYDSPATTGKVLAFICAAYPPRKNMIEIRSDFLEPCFDCDAGFEGRIILGWLLILALVMVLNRDVIYVIRKFLSKK